MITKRQVSALAIALLLALTMMASSAQPAVQAVNLLTNPGFEEGFSHRVDPYEPEKGPQGPLYVADGWELWYDNRDQCREGLCCYNFRPEYKDEDGYTHTDPQRVHSGRYAQKMFNTYATHTAGLYQRVAVPEGILLRFSIWVMVWSSQQDDPHHSTEDGNYRVSVGIDPYGGTDPFSEQIVWSEEVVRYDEHIQLSVVAEAKAGYVTVFTRGRPEWWVKHNDSYWDDASLTLVTSQLFLPVVRKNYGPSSPTPTPTGTLTPTLTPTPTPTFTPTPTSTPTPTPTFTPTPTATPTATLEPYPMGQG